MSLVLFCCVQEAAKLSEGDNNLKTTKHDATRRTHAKPHHFYEHIGLFIVAIFTIAGRIVAVLVLSVAAVTPSMSHLGDQ